MSTLTRQRTPYSVLRTGNVDNDRNFDAIAGAIREIHDTITITVRGLRLGGTATASVRKVSTANGVIAPGTTVLISPVEAVAGETLAVNVSAYASGTEIRIGPLQDLEVQLYNPGISATTYRVRLKNNSDTVSISYGVTVTGVS